MIIFTPFLINEFFHMGGFTGHMSEFQTKDALQSLGIGSF